MQSLQAVAAIGLATAKLFQQVGAKIAISGRNQKSLDEAVRELGGVVAVRSDVSKLGDLDLLFDTVTKKLGRIDVLFANAGIAKFAPVSAVSEDDYDETFDINVKGVFFTIQKAIPFLKRQRFSHSQHIVRQPSRRSHDERLFGK